MDKENERNLLDLRNDLVFRGVIKSGLKNILLKYFPKGTKIIITKDCYIIEEAKTEENEI